MITSASEYDFVVGADVDADHPHGDLDRILVNGEIMPNRDENRDPSHPLGWKNALRGEDIAFLMEAAKERTAAEGESTGSPYQFRREIRSGQLWDVASSITVHAGRGDPAGNIRHVWLKELLPTLPYVFDYGQDGWLKFLQRIWPSVLKQSDLATSDSAQDYAYPLPLDRSLIEGMFRDVAKMRRCVFKHDITVNNPSPHSDAIWENRFGTIYQASSVAIDPPANRWRVIDRTIVRFEVGSLDVAKTVFAEVSESECTAPEGLAERIFGIAGISGYQERDNWAIVSSVDAVSVAGLTSHTSY